MSRDTEDPVEGIMRRNEERITRLRAALAELRAAFQESTAATERLAILLKETSEREKK